MSDTPDNLILVYLRRLSADMARLTERFDESNLLLTNVERQLGQLAANEQGHYATTMSRLDSVDRRLATLERHADLLPTP